jgi:hypothetical protein
MSIHNSINNNEFVYRKVSKIREKLDVLEKSRLKYLKENEELLRDKK